MRVRFKVNKYWLVKELEYLKKAAVKYKQWEQEVLQKAKEASDLRGLRKVLYEMGERWEWKTSTGEWLLERKPFDNVCIAFKVPSPIEGSQRFIVYVIMAFSKGATEKFDHLGDKERIIIEQDKDGEIKVWSTIGHGAVDLKPTRIRTFNDVKDLIENSYLVAEPGDHALRLDTIESIDSGRFLDYEMIWKLIIHGRDYETFQRRCITPEDIEDLKFDLNSYVSSVLKLDKLVNDLKRKVKSKSAKKLLRQLWYIMWHIPPAKQEDLYFQIIRKINKNSELMELAPELVERIKESIKLVVDLIERAEFIKWESVLKPKAFWKKNAIKKLSESSKFAIEAFATALEDIITEHSLYYIGYPEKATSKHRIMQILMGTAGIGMRILYAFSLSISSKIYTKYKKGKMTVNKNGEKFEAGNSSA